MKEYHFWLCNEINTLLYNFRNNLLPVILSQLDQMSEPFFPNL
jgi:hypothetical protein